MCTIKHLSNKVLKDLEEYIPDMNKSPREKLSLCIAAILEVRSCNTMEISAALPLESERNDMRYQWLSRFLRTGTVDNHAIMTPFIKQALRLSSKDQDKIILSIDQTSIKDKHGIVMISVRYGNRSLPLSWLDKAGKGNIRFSTYKSILDNIYDLIPKDKEVILMGDRFYGCCDLISYCQSHEWDYRLRLKESFKVDLGNNNKTFIKDLTVNLPPKGQYYQDVLLTNKLIKTNLGILHEKGHPEPWIIASGSSINYHKTLDYGLRWGIESMFSDFKSRGFGLEETNLECPKRVSRLILILSIALHWATIAGILDENNNPLPQEKKQKSLVLAVMKTKKPILQLCQI